MLSRPHSHQRFDRGSDGAGKQVEADYHTERKPISIHRYLTLLFGLAPQVSDDGGQRRATVAVLGAKHQRRSTE